MSTDKIINDYYKKVDTYMWLYYGKRLDQLETTDVPGYWRDRDGCMYDKDCYFDCKKCKGPYKSTYKYLDRGRDKRGRFESKYKTWKYLKANNHLLYVSLKEGALHKN